MNAGRYSVRVLRWLAVLLTPFLAAGVAQVVVTAAIVRLLFLILGEDLWRAFSMGVFSLIWADKSASCFFTGAAFVLVARWAAPVRKNLVATVALGIVFLWGARLVSGAFLGSRFFPWLVVMGVMGWLGGVAAYFTSRRPGCPEGALAAQRAVPAPSQKARVFGGPASHAVGAGIRT